MVQKNLNPKSPMPLYYQLKEILEYKIDSGEWSPDQLIPTENELIQTYNVSRTTVREAITALVNSSKLYKKQGRGTIVCHKKIEQVVGQLSGFSERISAMGYTPGAKLLIREVVQAPALVKEKLNLDDDEVLYVKRIRLADQEPIAIEETYWPWQIGKLYEGKDLNEIDFYPLIEANGYHLSYGEELIGAGVASKEEAGFLQIRSGDPLLRVQRTTYVTGGQPIQYISNHYRSDRYVYKVHLER